MGKTIFFLAIFLFFIEFSLAFCEDGQIDVNYASLEELDNLYGIGQVKAQEIINSRPYNSVGDLDNVKGIGEKTLDGIIKQGLACVDEEEKNEEEEEKNEEKVSENGDEENDNNIDDKKSSREDKEEKITILEENGEIIPKTMEIIRINSEPKDIKNNNSQEKDKNYAYYGLGLFSVLLAFLFYIKNKKYRNEFK
jgi:competence ComEA-like helix-hairpin-helix protein